MHKFAFGIAISLFSFVVIANTTAITVGELGETVNAGRYIPRLTLSKNIQQPGNVEQAINKNFVVHSKLLTPGVVTTQAVKKEVVMSPVYLVGTDPLSVKWLKHNLPTLKSIGARGYLVNVNGKQAYDAFTSKVGIKLLPISGDGFARAYHLTHYPILIGKKLIEQ